MTAKRYQVVGECAHVEINDISGLKTVGLLYRGAFLPDGVSDERVQHLIGSGLVAEVGDTPIAPNASEPQDPAVGIRAAHAALGGNTGEQDTDVDPEVLAKRKAAADKLPADGSAPHANAGKDVWVEFAVAKGMDRGEAEKVDKSELTAALKG